MSIYLFCYKEYYQWNVYVKTGEKMKLLYFCLIVILFKLLFNIYYLWRVNYYLKIYKEYLEKSGWKFIENQMEIIKLFNKADVQNRDIHVVKKDLYGYPHQVNVRLDENIAVKEGDVVSVVFEVFHVSIGVFRQRIFEAINPLYWLEVILFLPKYFLSFIGVKPEVYKLKILQVVYWIISFFYFCLRR